MKYLHSSFSFPLLFFLQKSNQASTNVAVLESTLEMSYIVRCSAQLFLVHFLKCNVGTLLLLGKKDEEASAETVNIPVRTSPAKGKHLVWK